MQEAEPFRIERLPGQLDSGVLSPGELRALRSVQAQAEIGTAQAQQMLQAVAQGASEARLTHEAKASLGRLAGRQGHSP